MAAIFDGKGSVLRNTSIVVEGSQIVAINPTAEPIDYDLRGLTILPGWIDAHVHITWSFGQDGKNAGMGTTTPEAAYRTASNAWATLMAGFTTIQSMDAVTALRDLTAKGAFPGPRILSVIEPLTGRREQTGTPSEIRAYVSRDSSSLTSSPAPPTFEPRMAKLSERTENARVRGTIRPGPDWSTGCGRSPKASRTGARPAVKSGERVRSGPPPQDSACPRAYR